MSKEQFINAIKELQEKIDRDKLPFWMDLMATIFKQAVKGECKMSNYARQGDKVYLEFSWEIGNE